MTVEIGRYARENRLPEIRQRAKPLPAFVWSAEIARQGHNLPALSRLPTSFVSDHSPVPGWARMGDPGAVQAIDFSTRAVQAIDFSTPYAELKDDVADLAKALERAVLNGADATGEHAVNVRFQGFADLAAKHETPRPVPIATIDDAAYGIVENFGYPDTLLLARNEQLEDPRPFPKAEAGPTHLGDMPGEVMQIHTRGGMLQVVRHAPTEHVLIGQFDPEIVQLVWHTPPSVLEHKDGSKTTILVAALALYAPNKWAVL